MYRKTKQALEWCEPLADAELGEMTTASAMREKERGATEPVSAAPLGYASPEFSMLTLERLLRDWAEI